MVDVADVEHQALPLRGLADPVRLRPRVRLVADMRDVVRADLVAHHAGHVEGLPVVVQVLHGALRAGQLGVATEVGETNRLVRRLVGILVLRQQHVDTADKEGEARAELLRERQPEPVHVDIGGTVERGDEELRRTPVLERKIDRGLRLRRGLPIGPLRGGRRRQAVSADCGRSGNRWRRHRVV